MKRTALFVLFVAATVACKKSESTKVTAPQDAAPTVVAKDPPAAPADKAQPPADDPWTKSQAPAAKDPLPAPFLWQVEKDGKTSYLLGTIHLGVDADARLPSYVFDKLDASPTFAMETDLNSGAGAMADAVKCVGCSLKKQLTAEEYAALEKELGSSTVAQIQGMKPMVAATMLSMSFLPKTPAMDGVLHGRATRLGKNVVFLEDAAGAAKVLSKWMDLRALKMMLDDVAAGKQQIQDMLAAYAAGDETKLLSINDGEKEQAIKAGFSEAEYKEQQADMLYNRNAQWLPAIEKLHAAGGGFIAVGALHLVGPKSVRELLEAKGYKITRISK